MGGALLAAAAGTHAPARIWHMRVWRASSLPCLLVPAGAQGDERQVHWESAGQAAQVQLGGAQRGRAPEQEVCQEGLIMGVRRALFLDCKLYMAREVLNDNTIQGASRSFTVTGRGSYSSHVYGAPSWNPHRAALYRLPGETRLPTFSAPSGRITRIAVSILRGIVLDTRLMRA